MDPSKESSSETTPTPVSASIGHVSVKAPEFYIKSPEAWFRRMDSQFVLAHISSSKTKFHHIMAALPEDIAMNLILSDNEDYEELKKAVLTSLKANKYDLIEKALSSIELADRKPSQILIEIKRRFADIGLTPDDAIIKSRLLKALPPQAQTALVGHDSVSVEQYAQIADSIMAVASFSQVPSGFIGAVKNEHTNGRDNYNQQSQRRDFSNAIRPFYPGQRPKLCNGHIFYGRNARTCRHWCHWPNKPSKILEANEKTPAHSRNNSPSRGN